MEGLIPMVYKAIKRTRTRSNYECLSTGAAQTFNITDFYVNGAPMKTPHSDNNFKGDDLRSTHLRRYSSVGELSSHHQFEDTKADDESFKDGTGRGPDQLVKFRTHRRMFSCLSGAA